MRIIKEKKIFLKLCSILLCGICFLSGCGEPKKDRSGYLNVAENENLKTLDNALAHDIFSLDIIGNCLEGLLNLDEDGKPIPGVAESYEVSENGTTYTFHLRDTCWSNGTPVTAEDFLYSWRRLATAGEAYSFLIPDVLCIKNGAEVTYGDGNGNFADPSALGIYADDAHTLRLELEVPVSFLPSVLAFGVLSPLNQEFYESQEAGMYGTSPETFLCNGPYELEEYLPGSTSVMLKKNEYYWDRDTVKLPGICFRIVSSENTAIQAFEVGDLDVVNITGSNIEKAKNDPKRNLCLESSPNGMLNYLTMTLLPEQAEGCFLNENLRHALAHAIDKRAIVENVLKDGSMVTNTFVPAGYAFSLTTGEDFSENQEIYEEFTAYDLEKAAEYLEKAKKELGKNSFTIELTSQAAANMNNVCQMLQQQIEQNLPGVHIVLNPLPGAEYSTKGKEHDVELYLARWAADYADPMSFMAILRTGDSFNFGCWNNEEYTELVNSCISGEYSSDYEQRWKIMKEAERIVIEDAGVVSLYLEMNTRLTAEGVSGIRYPVTGSIDYKYAEKK